MIKKFVKKIWKSKSQEEIYTPKDVEVDFGLKYKDSGVGILSLRNGEWTFRYSETFKKQSLIKPLTDFPNVEKTYTSVELYPFFIKNPKKIQHVIGICKSKFLRLSEKRWKMMPKGVCKNSSRMEPLSVQSQFVFEKVEKLVPPGY